MIHLIAMPFVLTFAADAAPTKAWDFAGPWESACTKHAPLQCAPASPTAKVGETVRFSVTNYPYGSWYYWVSKNADGQVITKNYGTTKNTSQSETMDIKYSAPGVKTVVAWSSPPGGVARCPPVPGWPRCYGKNGKGGVAWLLRAGHQTWDPENNVLFNRGGNGCDYRTWGYHAAPGSLEEWCDPDQHWLENNRVGPPAKEPKSYGIHCVDLSRGGIHYEHYKLWRVLHAAERHTKCSVTVVP